MASLWFYNVLIFLVNYEYLPMYSIIIKNAHGLFKKWKKKSARDIKANNTKLVLLE